VPRKDALESCTGFEWDENNAQKNWDRHGVMPEEAEQTFFNDPFVLRIDSGHSQREKRYIALGQTGVGRRLFISFTIRRNLVRVISVRGMNRREQEEYKRHEKNS
jgi:uncharacterized DUF497 family protein